MNDYNIVLLPSQSLHDVLTSCAQNNFKNINNGYCLSDHAHPHITLCQYRAEHIIKPPIDINQNYSPTLNSFNTRQGHGLHQGFLWLELTVVRDDWLIDLQKTIHQYLSNQETITLTATGEDYHPHVTFCRTTPDQYNNNFHVSEKLLGTHENWTMVAGKSDKNGQFLGS